MDYEAEFRNLVDTAFECEREEQQAYFSTLNDRVVKIIYRDTKYNIDFLYTAYVLKDQKIMEKYAVWLYELLDAAIKNQTSEQTKQYVVEHFEYIKKAIPMTVSADKQEALTDLVECAQRSVAAIMTEQCVDGAASGKDNLHTDSTQTSAELTGKTVSIYEPEIQKYKKCLFDKDTKKAIFVVRQFVDSGLSLNDIYVDILAESMRRIGELWHTGKITVDIEHYCTSVTQTAMAQLYPLIFEAKRKNKSVLCACPGTELHEMGARMVADIFENDGWDSIYLGAAVPEDALMDAIEMNMPDLVVLSVAMPQNLITCQSFVGAIRRRFPEIKIAVGGQAFRNTNQIWQQWPVDFYTEDARDLLKQANLAIKAHVHSV